jgi:Flp pilus assembly protein CpaB
LWTAANANRTNDDDSGATVTLLQNIEILAADQQMAMPDDKTNKELRSVTLQVTETDAKKLSLAQQNGTLNLALRNSGDLEKIDSPVVTMRDIRYAQGKPPEIEPAVVEEPAAPPQPVRVRIRTLHGRQSGEVRLELYGRAAVPEPPAVVPAPLEAGAGAERLVDSGG